MPVGKEHGSRRRRTSWEVATCRRSCSTSGLFVSLLLGLLHVLAAWAESLAAQLRMSSGDWLCGPSSEIRLETSVSTEEQRESGMFIV